MKRMVAILAGIALIVALASCGGGGSGQEVTIEEAETAFIIGFGMVVGFSFAAAFGREVKGVTIDPDTGDLVVDNFSFSDLTGASDADIDFIYTSMSGTVSNDENAMIADLTFEGGPVESLRFEIDNENVMDFDVLELTATVNGRETDLSITNEEFNSFGQ
jgi:hypothetical protein